MKGKKLYKQVLAMLLSFAVIIGMLPIGAMAETTARYTNAEIIGFEDIEEEIAEQSVKLGTPIEDLKLPTNLMTKVIYKTVIDAVYSEDEIDIDLSVTWNSQPEYNPDNEDEEAGEYIFTPQLQEDYTLAEDVKVPRITIVTVIEPYVSPQKEFTPMGGGSLGGGGPIDITNLEVSQIKTEIETAFSGEDSEVIVTGSKTEVVECLEIEIPTGKTLVWKAQLESISNFSGSLILLAGNSGEGNFEIAEDSLISVIGNETVAVKNNSTRTKIIVSGATVSAEGDDCIAIHKSWNTSSALEINNGHISAKGDYSKAIWKEHYLAPLKISGGRVSASGESCEGIKAKGDVIVSDNVLVEVDGDYSKGILVEGYTIKSAKITIADATVTASGKNAYSIFGGTYVTEILVSGSTVIAEGGVKQHHITFSRR